MSVSAITDGAAALLADTTEPGSPSKVASLCLDRDDYAVSYTPPGSPVLGTQDVKVVSYTPPGSAPVRGRTHNLSLGHVVQTLRQDGEAYPSNQHQVLVRSGTLVPEITAGDVARVVAVYVDKDVPLHSVEPMRAAGAKPEEVRAALRRLERFSAWCDKEGVSRQGIRCLLSGSVLTGGRESWLSETTFANDTLGGRAREKTASAPRLPRQRRRMLRTVEANIVIDRAAS
ncbi:hypothetical protein LTR53_006175 [Teratosphaeriaceae sp. CCFEE 6253]|nr:hypothetical protein LTR53_006175 [Teratosphaeriaceae sp. CCFEE 6253]